MIDIVVALMAVSVIVVLVLIFVTNLRVKLLIRLEIFWEQQFRIFGYEILGQSGQTVGRGKTNQDSKLDLRSFMFFFFFIFIVISSI